LVSLTENARHDHSRRAIVDTSQPSYSRLPGGEWVLASDKDMKTDKRASQTKVQSKDRDMGSALRSAYQRTVDEDVPDEMLDLLNKLS
jgi:hypothetical protein